MKKTNLLLSSAVLLATVVPTATVNAAITATDKDASASTTAEFTVKPGELTLDSAPDFNFGEQSLKGILTKTIDQSNNNNIITPDGDDSHTKANENNETLNSDTKDLSITDYRGAGSVWALSATLSPFENKNADSTGTIIGQITLGTGAVISKTTNQIWDSTTANTNGQGTAKYDLSSKPASLSILSSENVQSGKYQATINWNLQNTAIKPSIG